MLRPEGDILRVERALGKHWFRPQCLPVDAVGRDEGAKGALALPVDQAQGLEAFSGRHPGSRVQERREVVRPLPCPTADDVARQAALNRVEPEIGTRERDPVPAAGVAGDLRDRAVHPGHPAVVEVDAFAILDHGGVADEAALPGLVEAQGSIGELRVVELQAGAVAALDERLIH